MKRIIFTICVLTALQLTAQPHDSARSKLQFFSASQIGLLEGSWGSSYLLQTVNGVQYRHWGMGLGVGLDYYRQRSIPVFVQVQRRLPSKRLPLFLYADAGLNIPWLYNAQSRWVNSNTRNGLYADAGLQYHWLLQKRQGLVFSLGYGEKRYTDEQTLQGVCITMPCPDQKSTWWYTYRRVVVKAGWRF